MSENQDDFEWARRLGCPPSAITESIGKSLCQGISGLMWEELSAALHPTERVRDVWKNILLRKLKDGSKDSTLRRAKNIVEVRAATAALEPETERLRERCREQDFLARQKLQRLRSIEEQRRRLRTKERLLRVKTDELKTLIEDGEEMRLVRRRLMPTAQRHVDSDIVDECLSLVGGVSTRADRKIALNKISENLGAIDVATLFNGLFAKSARGTEELRELGTRAVRHENLPTGENMDVSIAGCRARCIVVGIEEHVYNAKKDAHEKRVMECIEKFENWEGYSAYFSSWLALRLEVQTLETEQKSSEAEIDVLKKELEQQPGLDDEIGNLESETHEIRAQMENCMRDIEESLILLKSAGSEIARTRDKLTAVLRRIVALRREDNQNTDYTNVDPSVELRIFHETIKLEAFDKLVLKDKVGAYRHGKSCIGEAALEAVTANGPSEFPMIRAPVYHLLNFYKSFATSRWLSNLENESNTTERSESGEESMISSMISPMIRDSSDLNCIEILDVTNSTCNRVRNGIARFDSIFDAWKYQTVQKVMSLDDRIVNGATFKEWLKRYDMMLHALRQNK